MDLTHILIYAGAAAVAYVGGKYLIKGDNRVEQRRLDALKVGAELRKMGMNTVPVALEHYAVGDYSGLAAFLQSLAATMTNTDAARAEFEGIFDKMLLTKLNDPQSREALMKRIESVSGKEKVVADA